MLVPLLAIVRPREKPCMSRSVNSWLFRSPTCATRMHPSSGVSEVYTTVVQVEQAPKPMRTSPLAWQDVRVAVSSDGMSGVKKASAPCRLR